MRIALLTALFALVLALVKLEHPTARRIERPDGGADVLVPAKGATPASEETMVIPPGRPSAIAAWAKAEQNSTWCR